MELNELLGIDPCDPLARRAKRLADYDRRVLRDLRALREKRGLTQQQVADRMQVTQSAVARIESGERDPRMSTLRRYAMAVGAMIDSRVRDDTDLILTTGAADRFDFEWSEPDLYYEGGAPRDRDAVPS